MLTEAFLKRWDLDAISRHDLATFMATPEMRTSVLELNPNVVAAAALFEYYYRMFRNGMGTSWKAALLSEFVDMDEVVERGSEPNKAIIQEAAQAQALRIEFYLQWFPKRRAGIQPHLIVALTDTHVILTAGTLDADGNKHMTETVVCSARDTFGTILGVSRLLLSNLVTTFRHVGVPGFTTGPCANPGPKHMALFMYEFGVTDIDAITEERYKPYAEWLTGLLLQDLQEQHEKEVAELEHKLANVATYRERELRREFSFESTIQRFNAGRK